MSIPFDPTTLLYAVVEYLPSSKHLGDPVDLKSERDGQYRLVCLTLTSGDAWRMTTVLRALGDGRYEYTVCAAEPDAAVSEPLTVLDPANSEQAT